MNLLYSFLRAYYRGIVLLLTMHVTLPYCAISIKRIDSPLEGACSQLSNILFDEPVLTCLENRLVVQINLAQQDLHAHNHYYKVTLEEYINTLENIYSDLRAAQSRLTPPYSPQTDTLCNLLEQFLQFLLEYAHQAQSLLCTSHLDQQRNIAWSGRCKNDLLLASQEITLKGVILQDNLAYLIVYAFECLYFPSSDCIDCWKGISLDAYQALVKSFDRIIEKRRTVQRLLGHLVQQATPNNIVNQA